MALVLFFAAMVAPLSAELPIYLGDSHAGTLYFLVRNLPPGASCTLLLFDAHDDATGIYRSDRLRTDLRQAEAGAAFERLLARWRQLGVIQCYNWLEPLMPDRIGRVVWAPAERLDSARKAELEETARARLDLFQEAAARACGPLATRLEVMGRDELDRDADRAAGWGEIVVSIDLDFFAALPDDRLEADVAEVWRLVMGLPRLRAVSFAVSSAWLRDRGQIDLLSSLALSCAAGVASAGIRFEPFIDLGPDRSNRAKDLVAAAREVPRLDPGPSTPRLLRLLAELEPRIRTEFQPERLRALISEWRSESEPK
ncbi:MAG TPA: hypothetical protein PLP29_03800 [Candidatus Ozemobacteraceae bacterium]|nr:hypothetical protein [Candidatus Ozemobacteraceae bacterium]